METFDGVEVEEEERNVNVSPLLLLLAEKPRSDAEILAPGVNS